MSAMLARSGDRTLAAMICCGQKFQRKNSHLGQILEGLKLPGVCERHVRPA
jgi:hypothetical protein